MQECSLMTKVLQEASGRVNFLRTKNPGVDAGEFIIKKVKQEVEEIGN